MKSILRHWPAVACIGFLLGAVYFAGDRLGEVLVVFALPILFAILYMLYVVAGKDEEGTRESSLIDRLQFLWFKLTMPAKKPPKDRSGEE